MATETEQGGHRWVRDLLETELERAGEEGLTKKQLQGGLSIGTDDLRAGLAMLEEEDLLQVKGGDRYVLRVDEVAVGQRPDADLEAAADAEAEALEEVMDDEDADALEPEAAPPPAEAAPGLAEVTEQVEAAEGFYRARIMLDVSFKPDAPGGDNLAVAEAQSLRTLAERGILGRYPDLAVSSGVVSVDAFDHPRHVWP